MHEKPRIIPTPAFVKYGADVSVSDADGSVRVALSQPPSSKEKIALTVLEDAVARFGGKIEAVQDPVRAHVHLGLLEKGGGAGAQLTQADRATFDRPYGAEQGYVIKPQRGARPGLRLIARDPQGLLYAAVSLAQLLYAGEDSRILATGVHVRDWPSFRYRANNWLLWCEIGRWSYDRGDGAAAYARRIERKLDFSLRNKINLLIFDGFGWNKERFPGYGALMRQLTRYARERGIKLLFGGYGAGYGANELYGGEIFRNRRSYPDGRIYNCYHLVERPQSGSYGSCLSNAALLKLKQKELREFVRAVEPGARYLHNMDCESIAEHQIYWLARCEECRRRWPNDAPAAPDGAAGAFAHHYDGLCEAIFSVKNRRSGYDAARDCTPIMISPAYTVYSESDQDWDLSLRYWAAVSRLMKHPENVVFGFREQLLRQDGTAKRFVEMRRALEQHGSDHGLCGLIFAGADGYINDHLFHASPVMSKVYEGAELLLNATGHAYQEPLQMLNTEYAWRAEGGAWFDEPLPEDHPGVLKQFSAYRDGLSRPAGIIGPDGFLEEACRRLYGPEAGPHIAEVNRLMSDQGDVPIPYLFNTAFHNYVPQWACDEPPGLIRQWRARWRRIADLPQVAVTETRLAHALVPAEDPLREDLAWMAETLLLGREAAEIFEGYCGIYVDAQERANGDTAVRLENIETTGDRLLRRIDGLEAYMQKSFPSTMLDYLGADIGYWPPFIEFARKRVSDLVAGARTGERGEPASGTWW